MNQTKPGKNPVGKTRGEIPSVKSPGKNPGGGNPEGKNPGEKPTWEKPRGNFG